MAAAADSVEITVLSLGGGEVTKLIASQETTVKELKEQISATASLPAFLLSLTFEETELEEAHTCGKLGWTGAVSIYMVVKSVDLDGHIASLRHTEEYLPAEDLRTICSLAQDVFMKQPILLELEPPIVVCGTTSSRVDQLNEIIARCGEPGTSKYLLLGNYVSKGRTGQHGIRLLSLLLSYKCRHPDEVFLLRGRQECASISRIYGFYDECKAKYSMGMKLWKRAIETMSCMPLCALIRGRIFCIPSGLSPDLTSLDQIKQIVRPTDVPDCGLICDLLWSTPDQDVKGWADMDKGVSYCFGFDVVDKFITEHKLDMICVSGQVIEEGYETMADGKLVSVFSCAKYCGEFDNSAAVMVVDAEMKCSFLTYGG